MQVKFLGLLTCVVLLGACAAKPPLWIDFDHQELKEADTVAFAFGTVPDSNLMLPGASCLLCVAAAAAANSKLSSTVKTYSTAEIAEIEDVMTSKLQDAGVNVVKVENLVVKDLPKFKTKDPNVARRDFRGLGEEHNAQLVIVVDLAHVGVTRPYSSYIPTGSPYAHISGAAYAVDVRDNSYAWYMPLDEQLQAQGDWKEEPDYHNLTNAYYRLVERLRDDMLIVLTEESSEETPEPASPVEPDQDG